MRFSVNVGGKWKKEVPCHVFKWLWRNDGVTSVVIDDDANTYYCGTIALMETYQSKWAAEGKKEDPRRASTFAALGQVLYAQQPMPDHTQSAAWCKRMQVLCSEKVGCGKECC